MVLEVGNIDPELLCNLVLNLCFVQIFMSSFRFVDVCDIMSEAICIQIVENVSFFRQAEQWVGKMTKSSANGKSDSMELEGRPARSVHPRL